MIIEGAIGDAYVVGFDKNMENDLPRWLYDDLENEQFGRDYILNIDNELFKLTDAVSIA
jgi:hypothetical protein